ncbi:MAG: hypothetical protein NTW78_01030 [Campylobacterales bacterium]|nr:hypothetical protein [Campylobacterales bacterium]
MPSSTPTLKRHNHRVHPCQSEKKQELLKLLLMRNEGKNIIVVTCETIEKGENSKNITFINDDELLKAPGLKAELLISYNLPDKAIAYMARIAHATSHALILLDQEEEKLLYPIETLIGRTIMQEPIEGFGPAIVVKQEVVKKEYAPREERKDFRPRNSDFKGEKKKFGDRPPRDDKPRSAKPYDRDKKDEKSDFKKPFDKDKSGFKKPYDKDKKDDKFGAKKPWDKDKKDDNKPSFKKPWDKDDKSAAKKPWDKDKKDDKSGFKKSFDKDGKSGFKKPYDKDKKSSTFLGKDENGKAIFSGKSGDRNHRHDGSKRESAPVLTGKKINIKSLKKPADKE